MAKKSSGGAGIVGLVAAMAGALAIARYLNRTKKGKMLKEAMKDSKEHVFSHAKKLGKVSKSSYGKIVDSVMGEYANMKTMTKTEVAALKKEMKEGWEDAAKKMKKKA